MKKITAYAILKSADANELTEKIGQFMSDGFQPYGQLIVIPRKKSIPIDPDATFYQAVVKYED